MSSVPVLHTPILDKIHELEARMSEFGEDISQTGLTHRFTPGLYIREIFMPKDSLWTTKVHKTEHPFVISQGKVAIVSEEGRVILTAPHTGVTTPGTKRALYIIEDTIWTTFHVTELTDIDLIETEIISQTHADYLLYMDEQKLLENKQ